MAPRLQFDQRLGVQLVAHTVQVGHGFTAGHLVRRAGANLGYVWTYGGAWNWSTLDARHYGERSSLSAALRVLVDIAQLPLLADDAAAETSSAPKNDRGRFPGARLAGGRFGRFEPSGSEPPPPPPPADPPPPPRKVDWSAYTGTTDVTGAIRDALDKLKGK